MKTTKYIRVEKPDSVALGKMRFNKNFSVSITFTDKSKLKLNTEFIADSIEHYLVHAIGVALKEVKCPSRKALPKK